MCGRFVLFSSVQIIAREFDVVPGDLAFSPTYNIAPPTQDVLLSPVVGLLDLQDYTVTGRVLPLRGGYPIRP